MPLDPEKIKALEANAELLASTIPLEKQERFKRDYLDVYVSLNEKIDDRLEDFRRDTASVICCVVGRNPKWVIDESWRQNNSIRVVCDVVMAKIMETDVFPSRTLMVRAMADIVKYCETWMIDDQIKRESRHDEKVS